MPQKYGGRPGDSLLPFEKAELCDPYGAPVDKNLRQM